MYRRMLCRFSFQDPLRNYARKSGRRLRREEHDRRHLRGWTLGLRNAQKSKSRPRWNPKLSLKIMKNRCFNEICVTLENRRERPVEKRKWKAMNRIFNSTFKNYWKPKWSTMWILLEEKGTRMGRSIWKDRKGNHLELQWKNLAHSCQIESHWTRVKEIIFFSILKRRCHRNKILPNEHLEDYYRKEKPIVKENGISRKAKGAPSYQTNLEEF